MRIVDLGNLGWRECWELQQAIHAEVLRGGEERLLFVEHPHVITLGRQVELSVKNLRYPIAELNEQGIDVVETDRGGNVTYHGPGQLVAYPILRLNTHKLTVGGYVQLLQEAVIDCLSRCSVKAFTDPSAIGVWVGQPERLAKICAIGVRIRRGATLHGLALNVTTDLRYFDLIVPCGLEDRAVTTIARVAGHRTPAIAHVKWLLGNAITGRLGSGETIPVE